MRDLFAVKGKIAVVTGGSRGIGLMIARGYVEAGARVYISSRKAEVCEQVAEELSRVGDCVALPADLSSEEECGRTRWSPASTLRVTSIAISILSRASASLGAIEILRRIASCSGPQAMPSRSASAR